jgi:glycosyltransferase involved in cell wall biosynthesis
MSPTTENTMDISIVVPCYQEEKHLLQSVNAIYELLGRTNYKFEMIFVDDCSKDKTRDIILNISGKFPNAKYIFHKTNVGRGGAFLTGANIACGKYVGFIDIDLEVSCVYIMNVLAELEKGQDVVTVRRHYAISPSPSFILRHILSVGYKHLIQKYLGIPRMDTETGFKFFNRRKFQEYAHNINNKKWFFDTEVMVLAYMNKHRIKEVDGLFLRRKDKTSTVNVMKDTVDYFIELVRFKNRLKKDGILK